MSAILIFRVFCWPPAVPVEAAASPLELQPDRTSTRDKDKSRKAEPYHDFFKTTHLFVYKFL
jgi:hypothetical protein